MQHRIDQGVAVEAVVLVRRAAVVLCAVILAFFSAHGPSFASETDARQLTAHSLSIAGDDKRVRIVVHMTERPSLDWFLLRAPHRLVVDLDRATGFRFTPESMEARGMVRNMRFGALDEHSARMIFNVGQPFTVEKLETLRNEQDDGWRMIADIVVAEPEQFAAQLAQRTRVDDTVRSTPKADRLGQAQTREGRPFTVVIDPGHGGIDGGAEGLHGTVEKTITLAFGLELRKKLEATGRYRIVMTRDSDKFLRLDERVQVGRQHEADLFISIHADTINLRRIRGATVYTISEEASDEIAHRIAEQENLADAVSGVQFGEEADQVSDILVDLLRRETQAFSVRFARTVVNELSESVELIKNPHRSAGFRVLTAPDMPSVLIELGYLSNPKDEALMRDPQWREKAASRIVSAVALYEAATRGAGG